MVRFPTPVYHAGRLVFGLATQLVTMAILLLAFHTAPVHKKIFGAIDYKYKPPFGLGLDHQWLGFFQYTTGEIFATLRLGHARPVRRVRQSGNERSRCGLRPAGRVAARPPGSPALRRRADPGRGRRAAARPRPAGGGAAQPAPAGGPGGGRGGGRRGPAAGGGRGGARLRIVSEPRSTAASLADSPPRIGARLRRRPALAQRTQLDQLEPGS